jgi:hypothetical protein
MIAHDAPVPWKARGWARQSVTCHLVADTIEELHEAAANLGLKREWYQATSYPHYDLMGTRLIERACRLYPLVQGRELIVMVKRCQEDGAG